MAQIVFWLSVITILYVYLGYPMAVIILGPLLNRKVRKKDITPPVTVLIAAYNERGVIEATLRNKLEQDYPVDRLEILVVSDGSTDGTDDIVRGIADPRVRLLRQEPRRGKTSALNLALPQAKGEIIIFSDANSIYAQDAIRHLTANFADPEVGYVTGKMIYADSDGNVIGEGCSAYMQYENILREAETRIGSVVGVDGGVDAVRKELYQTMNHDQLPDFVLPLRVVAQGYRVVYEPRAMLREAALKATNDEYRMRVRVSLRAMWALFDMRKLLISQKYLVFTWQLWSHKMLRYLCFLFLALALITNLMVLDNSLLYWILFCSQVVAYVGAWGEPHLTRNSLYKKLLRFVRYFLLINIAAGHAFAKFMLGKKQVLWTPRKG